LRARYILSQWWTCLWLAACVLCLAACGREAGTFSVSFGFADEKPDPETEYTVYVRVKDEHWTTVAESPRALFDPDARLQFPSVRNGNSYTIVVELHTFENDRIAFFGRSKPFDLHPGTHVNVQVELAIQAVPRGVLRILEARGSTNVRSKVRERLVTLAFSASGATEATLANDEKLNRGKTTRPLDELTREDGEYRWPDWDLDAELCDEPPCLDGEREVYLQLTNSTGYHSEPVRADIELDTTPPELTSHRLEPMTAADGVPTTLQVIASEPLSATPEVSVVPADFSLTPNMESVPGEMFSFHYTVDAQALDQQAYQFQVKLVDIAGNENEVSLGGASELRIESELRALSAAIERLPAFAPFAGVPVFSRTDPVSGEPVRVRVTVESSRPYDDQQLRLIAQHGKGHTLDFEYVPGDSDKNHAVFTRTLADADPSGSYGLQLDWRDRSGRAGDPDGLRSFTIRDAPKAPRWGVVDSSLDERGEPRTLYIARPWGALTAGGHAALGDSLRGRVVQHAERAEDCIAQVLIYGDASSDGTPRPASLLSVAEVNGVSARGCKTESSTFDVTFSGHSDYHLHVVPVTVSGHRGPAQTIAHNEWVATLPEAVSGGTAAYPHQLLTHMRPPTSPLQAAEPARLPAQSSEVPYAGSWEPRHADLTRPLRERGGVAVAYDPNHGRTLLFSGEPMEDATLVWQWDGSTWSSSRSKSFVTNQVGAVTYDRARDRLLVVGGGQWSEADENGARRWDHKNGTWEWDGSEWLEQHPVHPLPTDLRALSYDPARQRAVALGYDNRIWEWDGSDWSEGPAFPMVDEAAAVRMAYDEGRKCLVAVSSKKEGTRTFEYKEAEWQERTSAHVPPGFAVALIAYDSLRNRVILHGGDGDAFEGVASSEVSTWQWNGVDWEPIISAERPARQCFGLLEEGVRRGVSLLCGRSHVLERWRLGPTGWSAVMLPIGPQGLSKAAMAYDERRKRVVLFGGDSLQSADEDRTWELEGATWLERALRSAAAVDIGGTTRHMTYDTARGVSLFLSQLNNREPEGSETLVYDGTSWQSVAHTPELTGRTAYAISYDATRERTVVFSGESDSHNRKLLTDTWEWDGMQWQQAQPEAAPSARRDHAMVFDSARGHTLLFGGRETAPEFARLADTWAWDGRQWSQLSATRSPPARSEHALAFDPERGRVVLFGGNYDNGTSTGPLADTWEWDGSTWTQIITAAAPSPRSAHSMVYDSARKRVLLFGGEAPNNASTTVTRFADLWSWDGTNWVELKIDALPSFQSAPSLAYDPVRKQTVMFSSGSRVSAEQQATATWVWDGEQWLRRAVPSPPTRTDAAMAFEPESGQLILTGGFDRDGELLDTWTWDGARWNQVADNGPHGNTRVMTYDSARKRMILVADADSFAWQDNAWQPLAHLGDFGTHFQVDALDFDRKRERGVLVASTYPEEGGNVIPLAFEWDGASWQSRTPFEGLLAYDTQRERLMQMSKGFFLESNVVSDVEVDRLHTLRARTAPVLSNSVIAYDESRRQLLAVGQATSQSGAELQTWLWSSFQPAHQVMVDLRPLFGTGRTTDVVLDGFAFRATGGANAQTEGASNPGVALELWNGRELARVQENDAEVAAPGELCFESHDPATLGALEVGKRWPFVLRPAADSDGPEPPRLQTNAFEVRVRYHLRGAEPALPPEPGSTGRRCATDGWAMHDVGASR
jgi:hypothetical protein